MSNQSFKVKNGLTLTPVDLTTLLSPQAGDLACDINDSNKIKRYDANASAWTEVGSGGVGGTDILFVQDFESASSSSFTQTGLTLSQVDPLHGKVSALLTHQAGTSPANDQLFKQVIPVDNKFRNQTMVLRLDVKSNASAGNVVIKIYDETNAANIVASEQLQLSNDVNGTKTSVSFTIPETCASLSYTITALPEAGSPVTRIDDIICELAETALLETAVEVPVVTAWQGYTPTFQGFGTPTNVEFEWRQVGENVEVRGKFVSGTSTAVEARVGLPAGLTSAGTSLIPSLQVVGKANAAVNNTTNFGGMSVLIEPSTAYITFGRESSTINGTTKANGDAIIAASGVISFFASVPCSGLSATTTKTIPLTQSGLITQPDENYQLNGFTYRTASTNTNILFFNDGTIANNNLSTISIDNNSVLGSTFTIQRDGFYSFNFQAELGGTAGDVYLVKNSTTAVSANILSGFYENGTQFINSFAWSGPLKQGDVLRIIRSGVVATFAADARNYLSISYVGNVKQVSVNPNSKITIPTSELRFEGASSRGSTATAIVKFDTLAKIRGDAFTVESDSVLGTRITMKKAGRLSVNASVYMAASSEIMITKNQPILTAVPTSVSGAVISYGFTAAATSFPLSGTTNVQIGDIIRVSTLANVVNPNNLANILNLAFQEQDISVSVTNTLPQFSESDSSVRVDTANGYGSTANKIRRFSNVRDNIGSDIAYNPNGDEAVNGASFVVKSAGVYNISYTEQASGATYFGLSKNSSQLTTSIISINTADRLAVGTTDSTSGFPETISWQGYLQAGDIIRAHTEGTASSAFLDRSQFTISKVGKPNVTGVDVTPFVNVPQPESQSSSLVSGSTFTAADITGALSSQSSSGIYSYNSSTGVYTMLKKAQVDLNISLGASGAASCRADIFVDTTTVAIDSSLAVSGAFANSSYSGELQVGQTFKFRSSTGAANDVRIYILAIALSDQILTAPETFSTDTASLTYAGSGAYTLSTLADAPVGTFITFTYAANTNTRTQTLNTAPNQLPADMNANGILLYTRAFNASSSAGQPAAIAIQIGKGLKGFNINGYPNSGKSGFISLDYSENGATKYGIPHKNYNETTGILLIDSAYTPSGSNTAAGFLIDGGSSVTSGYLVINASKNPALTGLSVLLPRIATLSDVKASGTEGGTATSGAYQTRILNTISDPTGIVTSLASNQFILPAGEYYIEASAPTRAVNNNKIKIRNITDSTDAIIGSNAFAGTNGSTSVALGHIVITSSKTFELQHRVQTTTATNGFGSAAAFGENEVYSIVKITKVK